MWVRIAPDPHVAHAKLILELYFILRTGQVSEIAVAGAVHEIFPPEYFFAAVGGVEPVLSELVRQDGLFAVHGDDQVAAVHGAIAHQDVAAVDGEFEIFHFASGIHVEFVSCQLSVASSQLV